MVLDSKGAGLVKVDPQDGCWEVLYEVSTGRGKAGWSAPLASLICQLNTSYNEQKRRTSLLSVRDAALTLVNLSSPSLVLDLNRSPTIANWAMESSHFIQRAVHQLHTFSNMCDISFVFAVTDYGMWQCSHCLSTPPPQPHPITPCFSTPPKTYIDPKRRHSPVLPQGIGRCGRHRLFWHLRQQR